ncbi:MAG: hypothetical protein KC493_04840 [Bacteriovoracaceae bacterium]|nr:hypothetical protein [Bacteriovoracaceae bacterium]
MKKLFTLTLISLIFLSNTGFSQEQSVIPAPPKGPSFNPNADVKVARVLGRAYGFFGVKKKPRVLKENKLIRPGTIVATMPSSILYLEFKTNGVVVVAPNSKVLIRGISQKGLQQVSLINGSMYVRTKRGITKNRPSGIISNIRSYKSGYYGENYVLTFTENKKEVSVKTGTVASIPLIPLEVLTEDEEDEEEEDDDDEDDDEDEDEDEDEEEEDEEDKKDYAELLEKQQETRKLLREKRPKKDEEVKNVDKSIDLEFFLRGVYYNQDVPENNTDTNVNSPVKFREFTGDTRLDWNLNRRKGRAYIYAGGWFEYGNQNEIYRDILQIFNNRKEGRGIIELNELYFLNSWDNVDLSVGKKVLKMGLANIHSPADRVTPKDLYDPLNHKDLGNYMLNPDFYIGDMTISYALVPFFLPTKAPRLQNRVSTDVIPDEAKAELNYPESELKYFQNVLQFKGTLAGWDYFLGFLYGPSQYATYRENIFIDIVTPANSTVEYFEEFPKVFISTFGYSTTFGKIGHYGEFLSQKSEGGQDDEFINYVLGINYNITDWAGILFMDQIKIIYEFSREKMQRAQYSASFIHSSTDSRAHKHSHLGRIDFEFTPQFGVNYSFDFDLLKDSKLQIYGLEYKPADGHKIRFNYETFEGSNESVLSLLQDTDDIVDKFERFTMSYNYTF